MRRSLMLVLLLSSVCAAGEGPQIYQNSVERPLDEVYDRVYRALENAQLFVVFEANLGRTMEGFAGRWAEDYNRNRLEGIRSMVFCNAWLANRVSNADPTMLALCPLHLTVIHRAGTSTVLFVRPASLAQGSAALPVLEEVEAKVIQAIDEGLQAADGS